MTFDYIEAKTVSGESFWVRRDRIEALAGVDVVVFDCDGVLIDVRDSYSRAAAVTAGVLLEALTGFRVPEEVYGTRLNRAFKRTGGFNNDWALTYAYVLGTLAELPEEALEEIGRVAGEALGFDDLRVRLGYLRDNRVESPIPVETLGERLASFAGETDSSGWMAVDRLLLGRVGPEVKDVLGYPGDVGESLLVTVFEEIFSGGALFERLFGTEAILGAGGPGLIEEEAVVIEESTLERLTGLLGGRRMGVASSSPSATAMHVLGEAITQIPGEARVWHEDVDEAQVRMGAAGLHKPHPFSLLRASEPFEPYGGVLYVGDTMTDRLMVMKAGEPRFLFAGAYGKVHGPEEAVDEFISSGSDVVAPTVNDLPEILERVRGITI